MVSVRPSQIMIHAPDDQSAVRLVQQAFPGGTVQHVWELGGGISANMLAVAVRLMDGRSQTVIVRTHSQPAVAEKEYRLLQILHGQGVKTPAPYLLDRLTGSLVLDYLPGEMNFAPADLNNYLRQMAAQLAHLHRRDVSQYDPFLPQAGAACVEVGRERPSPNPNFPQEHQMRQTLAAYELPPAANKPTLLHGDFWPGNCLWLAGELTAVIDWEDAMLGDPLIDLAQSRSEIAWIFGPEAVEVFTGHYRQQISLDYQPLEFQQLPYRDLCAALRQIRLVGADLAGFAGYFGGYGRTDITPATIRQNLNTFIDNALAELTD
ncbi:MAG: phosphotransferase [Anaerolineaceae bacterium]|nr:phosphotransferase [Anaerolineaceae bacterium]